MRARAVCLPVGKPSSLHRVAVFVVLLLAALLLLSSCTDYENAIGQQMVVKPIPKQADLALSTDSVLPDTTINAEVVLTSAAQLKGLAGTSYKTVTISNKTDTIITGKKGVQAMFPAGCFELPYANAQVKVEMQEYNSQADFFFAGLTTLSNGKLLESGGTVYINATCDGKEVKMKQGKQVQLAFPTGRAVPGMQTFYGQKDAEGNVNWEASNNFTTEPFKNYNLYTKKKAKGTRYIQKLSKLTKANFQVQALGSYGVCTRFADTGKYKNILEYYDDNFEISANDAELLKGSYIAFTYYTWRNVKRINAKFVFWPKNYASNKEVRLAAKRVKDDFLKALKKAEGLESSRSGGCMKAAGVEEIRLFINDLEEPKPDEKICLGGMEVKEYEAYDWEYNQHLADSIAKVDARYYFLKTEKLGWINCDRFYKNEAPRTDVFVDVKYTPGTEVVVVFKDIMSVMHGIGSSAMGGFTVANIPTGCNVKYIAMQNRSNGLYYAVKDASTSQGKVSGFEFKPMTVAAIKKELAGI